MKKLLALFACVLMIILACSAVAEPISIAICYPDTVDDKGWCQSMHMGVEKAIAMGYEIDYTPVESVATADAPNTLDQLADNYDIIICHGAMFNTAVQEIGPEYPDQIWAAGTTDQLFGENIFTFMPQSEEPGYINGVIAGLLTKSNKVGIVGSTDGADSARYVRGFVMGLQESNPAAAADYMLSWTGSFSDTVGAGDIGNTFIQAGCDVLVGPAQQAVGALRNVAATEGVLWVGQTTAQLVDFPEVVVAAADYDYSAVIVGLIDRYNEGKTGNECLPLNYNNNGFVYTFSENAELLPEDVKAAAQAAWDKLVATANTLDYKSIELK
ncbi:MAG: BMP family ABC transporter substrate-binding protein [Clostridia bacterium]|nr:BMP family ABC transporter substrate-binding protein [Clostridia bacterium]